MGGKLLLLDLDRTLVDLQSFTDYAAALADAQSIAGQVASVDVPETDWDRPTQACMSLLNALAGSPAWIEASASIARYERAAIPQAQVMPTVLDTLEILRGHPVAVVTLLPADVSVEVLQFCGIQVGAGAEVDLVIGRDPGMRPKPHPDGLQAACQALGRSCGEATMIGDSTWDRDAAWAAGSAFIGVPATGTDLGPGVTLARTFAEAVRRAVDN